jgi:hypothetical protein
MRWSLFVFVRCCRFTFDHVYDQDSSQQEVYNQSARPLVLSTLQVLHWKGSRSQTSNNQLLVAAAAAATSSSILGP